MTAAWWDDGVQYRPVALGSFAVGAPVSFNYSDCNYGDNNGSLTVQIFNC